MQRTSVLIIDQNIDHKGIIANASFVLGLTAGREMHLDTFGWEVTDGDLSKHQYLTKIGHFVRKAGQSKLKTLRQEFINDPEVLVIDYTESAAPADYEQYANSLAKLKGDEIKYRAIHLYGPAEKITPKTKNLSAL